MRHSSPRMDRVSGRFRNRFSADKAYGIEIVGMGVKRVLYPSGAHDLETIQTLEGREMDKVFCFLTA